MLTKLKARRLERGMTQQQVVERTAGFINQYRISILERGVPPRIDEKALLAYALDTSVEELFPEQGESGDC